MSSKFRSPKRLPYNANPEKSDVLLVHKKYSNSPLGYFRKSKDGSRFYKFEITGFIDELDDNNLPDIRNRICLSESMSKEEFLKNYG